MTAKPFFLGMSRLIAIAFFAAAAWGLIVEGNLSAGLSRGAAGPRKHKFCAGGDEYRDELQRHGIGRWEDLQLPGPGNECREEPERILRRGKCGDRFAYDRSSQIALNEDGSPVITAVVSEGRERRNRGILGSNLRGT